MGKVPITTPHSSEGPTQGLTLFLYARTAFSGAERIMSRPDHSVSLSVRHSVIDFGVPVHRSYQPILMKFGMWLRLPFNRKDQVPDLT